MELDNFGPINGMHLQTQEDWCGYFESCLYL
jgi:hypothetical protein